ncbi:TPA: hypothetical protein RTG46_001377 [Campylobacter jejuni]|nr:hypothetical protein [Campylobacter jejuni]HDZ5012822.1 hypothetical protein [Campylobacter jejuni]HDZ5016250.1 hypothetical protein [Campylobacter jejuni]HDZ5024375.1 hypothetical protein [Campylobacter jejuni]HDZ5032615.1 hypothetical protein [Campylobacter jejuni]
MKEFLSVFLRELNKELNIEIYPLSRQKTKLEKAFLIYEVTSEELNLSIDNKILNKELEINLNLYTPKYKDLRELKRKIEGFILRFYKKPIEFLMHGEDKDEESGFFMSEIFITYRL